MGSIEKEDNYSTVGKYQVTEEPIGTTRRLRVILVGAGASGLNTARHMELHMENFELAIYEKNEDIGGTWFENRYPGCACDIPSHNYQFTWEPNPTWSKFYSTSQEILAYFKKVAEKYELYKYIHLSHKVTGAIWQEDSGTWQITGKDMKTGEPFEDWCHIFINGTGILNNWKWPNIPGLHSFAGTLIHSADWKDDYDLKGKRVAVLGCGSSGVQIVPTIQPLVESLVTFIRSPTWITAGFAQNHAGPGGANFECKSIRRSGQVAAKLTSHIVSEAQKHEFVTEPEKYMKYRKEIEGELNQRFRLIITDSPEQAEARQYSINEMTTKLGHDERLMKAMIPDFAVGCRRPTPGNGYLEALGMDNVRVVTDHISHIIPEGIVLTTGETLRIDTFICATGFDISFCPRFKMIGRKGKNIAEEWKSRPEAYLSITAEDFPNYFMFLGPNSPVGHGSVLPIIEHATKYIINFMKKIQTQNIKAVVPSPAAIKEYNVHVHEFLKRTAWATPCRSWFKNGSIDGPIVALHPGGRIHWFHLLQDIRFEDYEYTYLTSNRFQYVGNGFSVKEGPGKDTTWYFERPEEGYRDY